MPKGPHHLGAISCDPPGKYMRSMHRMHCCHHFSLPWEGFKKIFKYASDRANKSLQRQYYRSFYWTIIMSCFALDSWPHRTQWYSTKEYFYLLKKRKEKKKEEKKENVGRKCTRFSLWWNLPCFCKTNSSVSTYWDCCDPTIALIRNQ